MTDFTLTEESTHKLKGIVARDKYQPHPFAARRRRTAESVADTGSSYEAGLAYVHVAIAAATFNYAGAGINSVTVPTGLGYPMLLLTSGAGNSWVFELDPAKAITLHNPNLVAIDAVSIVQYKKCSRTGKLLIDCWSQCQGLIDTSIVLEP